MTSYTSERGLYETWVSLRRSSHIAVRARNIELKQYGLSSVEAAVLDTVDRAGDYVMSPYELSRRLLREPHTVSTLVRRMQKKGLLDICSDTRRKNVVRLALTAKGREAYRNAMKLDSVRTMLSVLSEEEQQQLRSCMLKLRSAALEELERHARTRFALLQ